MFNFLSMLLASVALGSCYVDSDCDYSNTKEVCVVKVTSSHGTGYYKGQDASPGGVWDSADTECVKLGTAIVVGQTCDTGTVDNDCAPSVAFCSKPGNKCVAYPEASANCTADGWCVGGTRCYGPAVNHEAQPVAAASGKCIGVAEENAKCDDDGPICDIEGMLCLDSRSNAYNESEDNVNTCYTPPNDGAVKMLGAALSFATVALLL
eukprot:GHVH01002669.1.p1 GENE.GHVH01002669.1~~GHVH01002669.1.p1  ORF type:complete len:208 (+),score=20.40 GHVH01002669.1:65-688(+)